MVKKYCRKCSTNKSREDFYKNRASKDGLAGYCKKCTNSYRIKWQESRPYYYSWNSNLKRARERDLPATWTYDELTETLEYFGGCAITGDTEDLTWDHVIPLEANYGGTTAENMIPIRRDLNSSKGFRNLVSWYEWATNIYGIDIDKLDGLLTYLASKNGMSVDEYIDYINYDSTVIYDDWRNKISKSLGDKRETV